MQQVVSQILLPMVLAIVMLGMGLGLTTADFKRVAMQPKATFLGLGLQLFFLPALALFIITVLPLSPEAAAGLFLVSLCPGGATSNLFSFIAKGDLALSVSLTGIVSLLSPFLLPLFFLTFLSYSGDSFSAFQLPLIPTIKQLAVVTLAPTLIGMSIRHFAPNWALNTQGLVKKVATIAMILIIVALMATNFHVVQGMISLNALAILLLSSTSILIAYWLARSFQLPQQSQRTIAIEVGIQNAGTAMMVALAIMHQPALAFVPLMYGLLMNLPAFVFVAWLQQSDKQAEAALVTIKNT
ncbi:bile acid:sodium symporter family protein [Reinekea sp.]|jgi:BASS family bile acid:Na+ symporter|uniref:bile acid:sodium symporter family protein n=1 Tax=Reinekea sp. TaxID=1970455 RepID=UPI00398960BE